MAFSPRQWFERQPVPVVLAIGFLAVALIGVADFVTGYEFSVALFYLAPVVAGTWAAGRWVGMALAAASAGAEIAADVLGGLKYSSTIIHFWNATMRVAFFTVVVLLLEALHAALTRERRLARRDSLTGLANRAAFFESAEAEILRARRYQRPLTVAYVDCDHFKEINDRSGHEVGDRVLTAVAEALSSSIRKTDIAARLGGDEFALIFPELTGPDVREVIAKLQARLVAQMRAGGWPTTFSVGVVTFAHAPESIDALLSRADELMYEVKRAGRDAVRFAEVALPPQPDAAEQRRAGVA